MKHYLLAAGLALAGSGCPPAAGQTAHRATYMQIYYEGASWLAGRPLLHYSPALRGKTDELVPEDSTAWLSPGAFLFNGSAESQTHLDTEASTTTISNGLGVTTYVRDKNGKMRPETAADRQQKRTREKARFDRQLNLLAACATLAHNTLTSALNAAAADGWEVVQMTNWGSKDGLVYLLRRR